MGTQSPAGIADNLHCLRIRVAAAATKAGLSGSGVEIVAVSKTYPTADVATALACGQARFGENRVQEATEKFSSLRAGHPALRLHLIGPLQTNKAREAVRLADVIETLDRPRLADSIATASQHEGRLPDLLVQVNVGKEPQKSGVMPALAESFIDQCVKRFGDKLVGLMCIPPSSQDPAPHFAWLAACAARHSLHVVSMGMSGDFETAILHGSTQVRIGSSVFGRR